MSSTYNFGQVIDAYIAKVFPVHRRSDPEDDGYAGSSQGSEPATPTRRHILLQCAQMLCIIALLITLSTYVLHVRSSYISTVTLRAALKEPVAPSERGFLKIVDTLGKLRPSKPSVEFREYQRGDVEYKACELDLSSDDEVLGYSGIRSRRGVAFWLQFGLIPSLFRGLNSYNKLVGNTVRLSFVRSDYSEFSYEVDKSKLIPNIGMQHQLMSVLSVLGADSSSGAPDVVDGSGGTAALPAADEDVEQVVVSGGADGPDGAKAPSKVKKGSPVLRVKLPYAIDGTYHTYSSSGGNFQYVTGDSVDSALTSLNMGCEYVSSAPYFPLGAVLADESTTSVTLEAFTSNAHDYTVSYVNVNFTFVRMQDGSNNYILRKSSKASSISSHRDGRTRWSHLLIFFAFALLSSSYLWHRIYLHRRYCLHHLKSMYLLDVLSKVSLVLCILAYAGELFWSFGHLPYIRSVTYSEGSYNTVVGVTRTGRIIDADMLHTAFNSLRKNILRGYATVGLFHIATFSTIMLLFVQFCAAACSGSKVEVMMRYFAFHSLAQFLFGAGGILFALCVISLINAYIVNFIRSSDSSFRYNFSTLSNILAGVLNDQVEAYFRNSSVLHTVSILLLLSLFSYFGIFILITMMLTMNDESGIESFSPSTVNGPFDNTRLFRLQLSCGYFLRNYLPSHNIAFLRHFAFARNRQGGTGVHGTVTRSKVTSAMASHIGSLPSQAAPSASAGRSTASIASRPVSGPHRLTIAPGLVPPASAASSHTRPSGLGSAVPGGPLEVLVHPYKRKYRKWRMVSYWLIVVGVLVFAIRDHKYHSVRRLLQHTIGEKLNTTTSRLPFPFKEYKTKKVTVRTPVDASDAGAGAAPSKADGDKADPPKEGGAKEDPPKVAGDGIALPAGGPAAPKEAGDKADPPKAAGAPIALPPPAPPGGAVPIALPPPGAVDEPIIVAGVAGVVGNDKPVVAGGGAAAGGDPGGADGKPAGGDAAAADNKGPAKQDGGGDKVAEKGAAKDGGGDGDAGKNAGKDAVKDTAKDSVKYVEKKVEKEVQVNLVVPRVSFPSRRISTRQELFHWLTEGDINSLFQWEPLVNEYFSQSKSISSSLSLYNRFFLVPVNTSLYLEVALRSKDGFRQPMFSALEHDAGSTTARGVVLSSKETLGLGVLFGKNSIDFPDVVRSVRLDALLVDENANFKLYRASITFDVRNSGRVSPGVKVRSIFGIHLSPSYSNWAFIVVSLTSLVLFVAFASWFGSDYHRFMVGYNYHHGIVSKRDYWRSFVVFFLNDYLCLVDLLVILLIGLMCGFYLAIYVNSRAVYSSVKMMSALDVRLQVNAALTNVRFYHKSLWVLLSMMVFLILLGEVKMFQTLVYMVYKCVKSALRLYMLAGVAVLLVTATFFFFLFVFASEHFNEFSRGGGFLLSSIRLLFNETKLPGHVFDNKPIVLLIYPICLVLKLWILNVIFCYLWSIWPKEKDADADALAATQDMFSCEDIEPYTVGGRNVNLTAIADDQLDLISDEVKSQSADEALELNKRFEEYNRQFTQSGMTTLEFAQHLHDKLGAEMHEILYSCESLQLKLEVVRKQCEIMDSKVDRNLETNISLLEVAVSDKKDELASVFATYKELSAEPDS